MTTGFCSNVFSCVRTHGLKLGGLAFLSAGLFLGGCNGKLKDENESLRAENADLKEKVSATEGEKTAMATSLQQTQSEKDRLAMELANARTAQPPTPASGYSDNPGYPKQPQAQHTSRIRISGDVLFPSGSATLRPEAKAEIASHLGELKNATSIIIEGYTDTDPVKKSKYGSNQALSKARADSVKDYLVTRGVSRGKISTVGKGAANPLSSKKESRRVEIVVAE
ncbi:MAG TPA: OmpA family protein [Phycisphaerales bacterium]|nr:OmpA family protein [Phycisphaerales bacterium]